MSIMSSIREWFRRIWYLLNRSRFDEALQAEIEAHRESMAEPGRFGNTLLWRERSRDVWGWAWLDALRRDLRFAARGLRRTPLFTAVATLSLALGLALTTSTVSIVNAYLIRSLPYPESDRLYHVRYAPPGPWEPAGMTALDWTSVADVVEFPIAASGESFYVGDGGYTQLLRGLRATRGFAEGLDVGVAAGRRLVAEDFSAGSEPVALIGYAVWRDRFGSDPGTIGRLLRAETESRPGTAETFRIVGVLAPGFYFGQDRAAVNLLVAHPAPVRTYMVRLRAGVPPPEAERRLTDAARRAATSPIPNDWSGVRLESARARWLGTLRPVLFGITVAVSLVLVIVCANVAVLMLLRSMQRQKEVAVRLALGSGWRHILRMLFAETGILCVIALLGGIAVVAIVLSSLSPIIEAQLGRPAPSAAGITVDTNVILIVGAIGVLAAIALSMVPLISWGRGPTSALRQDARVATEGKQMRHLRSALIAFEIAGSLVLLVGCGLMVRSVVKMMNTDLGFDPAGLSASRIMLRARNYPNPAAYRSFHERFAGSVSTVTGSKVVFSSWPPFVPPPEHVIEPDAGAGGITGGAISVSAGYFSTFDIAIKQGREFTDQEASAEAPVAVISETLAHRLWPADDALGRRVRDIEPTPRGPTPGPWRTVIGIAADVRQTYDDDDRADFYMPRTPNGRFGSFYVRSERPGPLLFDHLQRAAAAIDRDALINAPHLIVDDDKTLAGIRFLTWMLGGFAAIAAFLAMLGIYGVTAYAVQQRQKEIAIRTALGASPRGLISIFLREGAVLLGVGTAAGMAGGIATARVLRNHVFGVQPFDAAAYGMACGVLLAVGFAAVFVAARRASLANPIAALNSN
jgi:putative ABC transport system permease protein